MPKRTTSPPTHHRSTTMLNGSHSISYVTFTSYHPHLSIMTTIIQHNSPSSSLMDDISTKSTIYRRHERRLARSYALQTQNDTRPAVVRVLSGLVPALVPPYQPQPSTAAAPTNESATLSEEPENFFESSGLSQSRSTTDPRVLATPTENTSSSISSLFLTTGLIGGASQALFATSSSTRISSSPFAAASSANRVPAPSPTSSASKGMPRLLLNNNLLWTPPSSTATAPAKTGLVQSHAKTAIFLKHGGAIGLLCGTKYVVDRQLAASEDASSASFVASAIAGALVGSLTQGRRRGLARPMLASTLFFGIPDTLLSNHTEETSNVTRCLVNGGSGILASLIYHSSSAPQNTTGFITTTTLSRAIRSAPTAVAVLYIHQQMTNFQ